MHRTNRTLSASSNRLDLRARSLMLLAVDRQFSLRQCPVVSFRVHEAVPVAVHSDAHAISAAMKRPFSAPPSMSRPWPNAATCRPVARRVTANAGLPPLA
jgi:hypothetical protein